MNENYFLKEIDKIRRSQQPAIVQMKSIKMTVKSYFNSIRIEAETLYTGDQPILIKEKE